MEEGVWRGVEEFGLVGRVWLERVGGRYGWERKSVGVRVVESTSEGKGREHGWD